MTTRSRFLVILIAYLCAALVWSAVYIGFGFLTSDSRGWDLAGLLSALAAFVPVALIAPLPVALPAILLTERRRRGAGTLLAVAGLVLGGLLAVAFAQDPYGFNLRLAVLLIVLSLCCAMIFWLIAWKLVPPGQSAAAGEG